MKTRYDRLANLVGFQKGDQVRMYRPTRPEVTEATIIIGRLVKGHHSDQRRGLSDPASSQSKNDGGSPRQTGAIPGGYLGRVTLRREQCDDLREQFYYVA
jgi:hypothetical protein